MFGRLFSSAQLYFSVCIIVLLALCLSMATFMVVTPRVAPHLFTEEQYLTYLWSFAAFIVLTGVKMLAVWVFAQMSRGTLQRIPVR